MSGRASRDFLKIDNSDSPFSSLIYIFFFAPSIYSSFFLLTPSSRDTFIHKRGSAARMKQAFIESCIILCYLIRVLMYFRQLSFQSFPLSWRFRKCSFLIHANNLRYRENFYWKNNRCFYL